MSELDGATGDGDHGANMNKGFLMAKQRIVETMSFSDGMKVIGRTLIMDIGGSMGSIYGTMFSKLYTATKKYDEIDKKVFLGALKEVFQGLIELTGANIGDKTLIDTLSSAIQAYEKAVNEGGSFNRCLDELKKGAQEGKAHTKDLVAKVGRATRLGERSKGSLDAGATSCWIILTTMASQIQENLKVIHTPVKSHIQRGS